MNKTISKRVFLRLTAQADEADIYGHSNIASSLTSQVVKYADSVRNAEDNEDYEYSKEELMEEIKDRLWDCATRIFDYYDETPDARDIQGIIDFEAESFVSYIESLVSKDVGPFEPKVIGEDENEEYIEEDDEEEKFVEFTLDDEEDDDDDEEE